MPNTKFVKVMNIISGVIVALSSLSLLTYGFLYFIIGLIPIGFAAAVCFITAASYEEIIGNHYDYEKDKSFINGRIASLRKENELLKAEIADIKAILKNSNIVVKKAVNVITYKEDEPKIDLQEEQEEVLETVQTSPSPSHYFEVIEDDEINVIMIGRIITINNYNYNVTRACEITMKDDSVTFILDNKKFVIRSSNPFILFNKLNQVAIGPETK